MKPVDPTIPGHMRAIREKAGLTQPELEDLLGLGPKVVTRWECGKVNMHPATYRLMLLMEKDPKLVKKLRKLSIDQEK